MLGPETVGVYVGGSCALGAYEPVRSDIDVAAVVVSRPSRAAKDELVGTIRHESLPCPARGLEFVLYRLESVRIASPRAGFELNLNSGPRMEFQAEYEPSDEGAHWFALDRSLLAEHGVPLLGPPPGDVFAPLPREMLLPLLVTAVQWHESGEARGDDAVLNACRAWRVAVEGVWSSKRDAGAWALDHGAPDVVAEALKRRNCDGALGAGAVHRFLAEVVERLERERLTPAGR